MIQDLLRDIEEAGSVDDKQAFHELSKQLLAHEDFHQNKGIADPVISLASHMGDVEILTAMLPHHNHVQAGALFGAAANGHTECIELLIPHVNAEFRDSRALRYAAENGHLETVKVLIPVSDPNAKDSEALINAAAKGHMDIMRELLPFADQTASSRALRAAASWGQVEAVKELIPISDMNFNPVDYRGNPQGHALDCAIEGMDMGGEPKNYDTIIELLKHADDRMIERFEQQYEKYFSHKNRDEIDLRWAAVLAEDEKALINQAMGRDAQALAQAAINGDEQSMTLHIAVADRDLLLEAITIVATTAEGAEKINGITALVREASNQTLTMATVQASERGDAEALKAIGEVVDQREMDMLVQAHGSTQEQSNRMRSRSGRVM